MSKVRPVLSDWRWQRWLRFLGSASWIASIPIWTSQLLLQIVFPHTSWLYDWHVYAAGAADFLDQSLYLVNLESIYPLPVQTFNYPPLAAILVAPLLVLPDQLAGILWIILNIVAVAATSLLLAKCLGVRQPMAWAGIGFAAYSVHPWAWLAVLGNNNPIVLLFVVAFVHQHLRGRRAIAGTLLGAAIALKLWPLALVPLLIRESRWRTLAWGASVVVAVTAGTLLWLGPDAMGAAIPALQSRDQVHLGNPVLGVTWLRETFDWWPEWGGYAVSALLLAIPMRGTPGLGLGILAGMAAIPNLWVHYLPTVVVGSVLLFSGIRAIPRIADEDNGQLGDQQLVLDDDRLTTLHGATDSTRSG